jgi:type II secretory pathway component PulF
VFADAPLFRSLASLHRAGVAWPEALASAAGSKPALRGVRDAVGRGAPLSEAFAPVVDPLDLALLRAGETTGGLEAALDRIADRHEAARAERSARLGALAYPVLIAHVAALLLPLPDLIQGRVLPAFGWSAAVLVPLYALLFSLRPGRRLRSADAHPGVRMPRARGPGRGAVEEADARALTALADLTEGGVMPGEALPLAVAAGSGGRVAWDLYRAVAAVRDGQPLASAWKATPPEHREALKVAEQAGELGPAARRLAARLRDDVAWRRKRLAALLPVVVILFVGALVGWRVISFYSQVYGGLARM